MRNLKQTELHRLKDHEIGLSRNVFSIDAEMQSCADTEWNSRMDGCGFLSCVLWSNGLGWVHFASVKGEESQECV